MMCPEYSTLAELDHPGDGLVLTLHGLNPHLLLNFDQLGPALLLLFPPQTCVHQLRPHAHSKASLEPTPLAVCPRYAVHLTGHVPTDTCVAPSNASTEEGPAGVAADRPVVLMGRSLAATHEAHGGEAGLPCPVLTG